MFHVPCLSENKCCSQVGTSSTVSITSDLHSIQEDCYGYSGTAGEKRYQQPIHSRQLGINPIQTSPYHPQTDGLMERFNQTLKNMLRKFVSDTGKDWDNGCLFCSLLTEKCPKLLQDSLPLSWCMVGQCKAR